MLQLTKRCNYNCAFCFVDVSRPGGRILVPAIGSLMDSLVECGISQVALSGGEPTLVANLDDIVDEARRRNLGVTLLTNGSRPTANALVNVDAVQISIDGPERVHDAVRGVRGAFSRAARAIVTAREKGIPISVQVTVTPASVRLLRQTIEAVDELSVQRISVVAVDDGTLHGLRGSWLADLHRVITEEVFSRPSGTRVTCNVALAGMARVLLQRRLGSGPLPLYVDVDTGAIALGLPEIDFCHLNHMAAENASLAQKRALALADEFNGSLIGPPDRAINLEAALARVLRGATRSGPVGSEQDK